MEPRDTCGAFLNTIGDRTPAGAGRAVFSWAADRKRARGDPGG